MTISIRDATEDDATIVHTLLTELGYAPALDTLRETLRGALALPHARVRLAERGDRVLGLITAHFEEEEEGEDEDQPADVDPRGQQEG